MRSGTSRLFSPALWNGISIAAHATGHAGWELSLPPKQAIHRFFAEIIDHSVKDRERKGCFLVNSALEVAPHQRELGAVIAKQFAEIEAFFKRCILAAQRDGSAPLGIDANDTARLLLGVLLGIRVLARSAPNRSLLEGMARPALALLGSPRHKCRKVPKDWRPPRSDTSRTGAHWTRSSRSSPDVRNFFGLVSVPVRRLPDGASIARADVFLRHADRNSTNGAKSGRKAE